MLSLLTKYRTRHALLANHRVVERVCPAYGAVIRPKYADTFAQTKLWSITESFLWDGANQQLHKTTSENTSQRILKPGETSNILRLCFITVPVYTKSSLKVD